jgi:hypothetical protein
MDPSIAHKILATQNTLPVCLAEQGEALSGAWAASTADLPFSPSRAILSVPPTGAPGLLPTDQAPPEKMGWSACVGQREAGGRSCCVCPKCVWG